MDDEADPDVFHTDTVIYGDDRPASPRGTQARSTSPEEMVDAEDPGALYADTDIHGYDKPTSLWETNDRNTDMDDTEIPTEEWDLLETQAFADTVHSSATPAYAPDGSPNGLHTIKLPRTTPLSWSKATLGLRQERIELENRARSDTGAELNASERQRLTFLSTAEKVYNRLLPKLKAASFDSFDRIPRRPRRTSTSVWAVAAPWEVPCISRRRSGYQMTSRPQDELFHVSCVPIETADQP